MSIFGIISVLGTRLIDLYFIYLNNKKIFNK